MCSFDCAAKFKGKSLNDFYLQALKIDVHSYYNTRIQIDKVELMLLKIALKSEQTPTVIVLGVIWENDFFLADIPVKDF